jgi:hypothetical protein
MNKKRKSAIISQSNFLPWRGYFASLREVDSLFLYDTEQFTKRDWRNRNIIRIGDDQEWLTLPIKSKGNYLSPIHKIETIDVQTSKSVINKIESNYRSYKHTSGYNFIIDVLKYSIQQKFLSQINFQLTKDICRYLNIEVEIILLTEPLESTEKNLKIIEICKQYNVYKYVTGPTALSYLNIPMFIDSGISVCALDYSELQVPKNEIEFSIIHHIIVNDVSSLESLTSFRHDKRT